MKPAIVYLILALVAMIANIDTQDLVIRGYMGAFDVLILVIADISVGLFVNSVLIKHFIFRFRAGKVAHDGQIFAIDKRYVFRTVGA
jgi:hypothetical protein